VGDGQWVVHNCGSEPTPEDIINDVAPTLECIDDGDVGKSISRNDGTNFRNRENLLPTQEKGYYREYVVPTPGVSGPGARRLVIGQGGEIYYTDDHYQTFTRLN
jgi:filamentous hemagglutinin